MNRFFLLLAFASLFLYSCATAADEELSELGETSVLAAGEEQEDRLPIQNFEASFMSEHGSFAYTFEYNGYLMQLVDTPLEGASLYGPSFKVTGGAEITVLTPLAEESKMVSGLAASQILGGYPVLSMTEAAGDCTLEKVATEFWEETLVVQLRVCSGDDAEYAEQALQNLFDGLTLKAL